MPVSSYHPPSTKRLELVAPAGLSAEQRDRLARIPAAAARRRHDPRTILNLAGAEDLPASLLPEMARSSARAVFATTHRWVASASSGSGRLR